MAKIPIEILNFSENFKNEMIDSVILANSLQESIEYTIINNLSENSFNLLEEEEVNTKELFDEMEEVRLTKGGFHPYWLMFTDKVLYNNFYNIFGSSRAKSGLGVFTTNSVVDTIIPKDKMKAYFIYYLGRYTLNYLNPNHKNHKETKDCAYDRKTTKLDITKSMKGDAFCDNCKVKLLTGDSKITIEILNSVNKLLEESGRLLNNLNVAEENKKRTKIFISYSHVDEEWKNRLRVHQNQ